MATANLVGHGDARWRHDGVYRVEHYASALTPVLTSAPERRWVLAGHSLGAVVAAEIARRASRRIAGVVLVDPAGQGTTTGRIQDQLRQRATARFATKAEFAAELAKRLPLAAPSRLERFAASCLCEADRGGWRVRGDSRVLDFDAADDAADCAAALRALAALDCPKLLVRGSGSAMLSRSAAEDLAAQLGPTCALETVPRAGHAIPLDNPAALALAFERFADRADRYAASLDAGPLKCSASNGPQTWGSSISGR